MHSAYNTIAFLHDNVGDQLRLSPQFRTVPRAGDLYIFPAYVHTQLMRILVQKIG